MIDHIIAQVLIEENVGNATSISLIKAKDALLVETLNALPVSLVDRRSIRFVQADLATSNHKVVPFGPSNYGP